MDTLDSKNIAEIKLTGVYVAIAQLAVILGSLYFIFRENFLLFHVTVEIISAVASLLVFLIVWNARRYIDNNYLLHLGISFFFVSLLTIAHTITYQGMTIVQVNGADMPTQFWLVLRLMLATSFLLAALTFDRKLRAKNILKGYLLATSAFFLLIISGHFPAVFANGTGLTIFKKISEYLISLVFLVSAILLYRKRAQFSSRVYKLILASILTNILVELIFTAYHAVTDSISMLGHMALIASTYFIYLGVVESGLVKPYSLLYKNLKDNETALKESEERYRSLTELSPFAIIVHINRKIAYVNQAGLSIFGYKHKSDLIGQEILSLFHPDYRNFASERIKLLEKRNQLTPSNVKMLKFGGESFPVEIIGKMISFKSQDAIQIVIHDLSRIVEKENMLKHAEAEWRRTFDALPDMAFLLDKDLIITKANKAAADYLKLRPTGIIGWKYHDLMHLKSAHACVCPSLGETLEKGEVRNNEYQDKAGRHYLATSSPIYDDLGFLTGITQLVKDITSLKEAEYRLLASNTQLKALTYDLKKFRQAVESASDFIAIIARDKRIIFANSAAVKISGYSREEMVGHSPKALWSCEMRADPGQEEARQEDVFDIIYSADPNFKGEVENRRKDGGKYIAEMMVSPITNSKGQASYFLIIIRDITRSKEIDKAKTEFVSLASHQLRTPLSSISLASELLLKGVAGPLDQDKKDYLDEIYASAKNMSVLISALLDVSRIELGTMANEPEIINLSSFFDTLFMELSPKIREKGLNVVKKIDGQPPIINFDKNILRLIVDNLMTNAIRYTPDGGDIMITISQNGKEAMIQIADTGCGIRPEDAEKVFEKLYRSPGAKEKAPEGAGLGLYIVRSVAEKAGVKVYFESEENAGTTFFVSLPSTE